MSAPQDPDELREVLATIDPIQIQIARDMLTEAGIESFVFDTESSRMFGSAPGVPSRLMVHTERADEALQILKELGFED